MRLVNQLWVGRTVLTPLFLPGRARRSVEEHRALITALQERNAKKAVTAMRTHIEQAAEEYFNRRSRSAQSKKDTSIFSSRP
ncbi:MAG: FCD domain-containing protein [Armatimonadetes bacterium]|nr:FCD domain-containing protein [Armatimonadota bacterium]